MNPSSSLFRRSRAAGRGLGVLAALLALRCGRGTPELKVSTLAASEPRVIAFDPPNGATDVDPQRTTLAVTFDRAMDREGWAWVIENPGTAPEIGESVWDASLRVNTAQVRLAPGHNYVVWVNSPQYPYFRDQQGHVAPPVRWTFSTRGQAAGSPVAPLSSHGGTSPAATAPRIVTLEPANGATGIDPATPLLRVTFDREMVEGWSWVIESGSTFPESAGEASMSADRRQAMLPVRLRPATTYVVWLNSEQHRDFADRSGVPLPPQRWTFTTRGAPPGR